MTVCFNWNRSLPISEECQLRSASQHLHRWDPCFADTGKQDQDFRISAVKESAFLSTFDAYRKNNPPQCSIKPQCRSGWRQKSPERISTPEIFNSVGELPLSKTPGALLFRQLCYSTYALLPHQGNRAVRLCYGHFVTHTMPVQHSTPAATASTS